MADIDPRVAFIEGVAWWYHACTKQAIPPIEYATAFEKAEDRFPCGRRSPVAPPVIGAWAVDDPRRAFVDGVAWLEYHTERATIWSSDRRRAEAEADRRYAPQATAPEKHAGGLHHV